MSRLGGATRRNFLWGATASIAALPLTRLAALDKRTRYVEPKRVRYRGTDDDLLEEIERAAFDFFWNEAGPSRQVAVNTHPARRDRSATKGRPMR